MLKLDKCDKCGAMVKPAAMADHWIIAGHILNPNVQAVSGNFAPVDVLKTRRAS